MATRTIELDGKEWEAAPSGRRTIYSRDEFGLVFTSRDPVPERRVARYTPLAAKTPELSLAALSDAELRELLRTSQPAWTSPERGYER